MTRYIRLSLWLSLFLVMGEPSALAADLSENDQPSQTVITITPAGIGWPGPAGYSMYALRGGISYGKNNHWFTLAGSYLAVLDLEVDVLGPSAPRDSYSDIGVMYGRRFLQGDAGFVYAGTGIAQAAGIHTKGKKHMGGEWFGGYEWVPEAWNAWSIPWEVRLVFTPSVKTGIVINWFENFNAKHSFGGIVAGVQFEP